MPRSHELSVSGCDMRSSPTWQTVAIVASTSPGMLVTEDALAVARRADRRRRVPTRLSHRALSRGRAYSRASANFRRSRPRENLDWTPMGLLSARVAAVRALSVGSHLLGRLMGVFDTWLFAALVRQEAEVYWIRARKRKLAEPEEVDDLLGLGELPFPRANPVDFRLLAY